MAWERGSGRQEEAGEEQDEVNKVGLVKCSFLQEEGAYGGAMLEGNSKRKRKRQRRRVNRNIQG